MSAKVVGEVVGSKINMIGYHVNKLTVIDISQNRTKSGSIKWICQCECGNICEVDGARLRSKKAVSCGCESRKALIKGHGLSFKDLSNQKFGKLTVIKRIEDKIYANTHHVQYLCLCDCGRYIKVTANNLRTNNTQSCGLCKENSHGNIKIDNLLTQANIPFIREQKFDDCRDILPLPFDFYVNNTYLIEYDGRQHYENKFKTTQYDIDTTIKHDEIKNEYCKSHNIHLIRIPYTHYKNLCLEDLLLKSSKYVVC